MVGQVFTTGADFSDDATLGRWGTGYQVLVSADQPFIAQFAKLSGHIAGRVVWEINDVQFPPGDYRFLRCHGIRFKTDGDTAATIYAITVFPEDPPVQGFSPSTTGGSVTIPTLAQVLAAGNDGLGIGILDIADPTSAQDAATKSYVDSHISALTLDEVLAAGNNAGGQLIENLANPLSLQDAATKAYVDALVVPQPLNVVLAAGNDGAGIQITDIADPTNPADAATKGYVDSFFPITNAEIAVAAAIAISKLAAFPNDATKVLAGDGSWPLGTTLGQLILIQEILGTGASPNIDFTNIPQTYRALYLMWQGATSNAAAVAGTFKANNTSAGGTDYLYDFGGKAYGAQAQFGNIGGSTAGDGGSSGGFIEFYNYAQATTRKRFHGMTFAKVASSGTASTDISDAICQGTFWINSAQAAITRLTFTLATGNWTNQTKFSLYGVV